MPERNQAAPATGSTRARTPARRQRPAAGAPESRARPDPDGAAAAPRREPAPGLQPGHRNGVEVMQVGVVSGNGP
ncbi:hypothetical protein [Arthrobacter crystallopoietes]|uniref:hypothetical protein n=1 Tax=Crystallibacter crystallopoietes TaxID=37928 RepID=UPI000C762E8F|nr:hypothetical protein [Arthrobacter crystallopoietes]AUI53649.1 hypothetical protein AC20117_22015 [Arthrobacter crystallopoietes]